MCKKSIVGWVVGTEVGLFQPRHKTGQGHSSPLEKHTHRRQDRLPPFSSSSLPSSSQFFPLNNNRNRTELVTASEHRLSLGTRLHTHGLYIQNRPQSLSVVVEWEQLSQVRIGYRSEGKLVGEHCTMQVGMHPFPLSSIRPHIQ